MVLDLSMHFEEDCRNFKKISELTKTLSCKIVNTMKNVVDRRTVNVESKYPNTF